MAGLSWQAGDTKGQPWEHPDWYDLHDTTWTAGPEREPEHYRELVLALPPLDAGDHLIDVGAGTGKLAGLIVRAYPRLGRVTLIEPNRDKLERARGRLEELLPSSRIEAIAAALGNSAMLPHDGATVVTVGSVLMPTMELRGGSLADGLGWLRTALGELLAMLVPGGWFSVSKRWLHRGRAAPRAIPCAGSGCPSSPRNCQGPERRRSSVRTASGIASC